ncbi:MAG: EFR1 family ferrodoxin [Candidatus Bipolaricaulis sp.]|nr:EFR1 family ferrodoxin [Candidatus Bipolaricaulis sp.]
MTAAATIYWFSGTGNSLAVARRLSAAFEGARLLPIASLDGVARPEGVVGVVCPVYFEGLPLIVQEFVARLDARALTYSFLVLTPGGFAGWAPVQARRLFRSAGRPLDAAFSVKMPDNYIAILDIPRPERQRQILSRAERALDEIAGAASRRERRLGVGITVPLGALAHLVMGRSFARACRRRDERFVVTDACTACGLCVRVCPKENIVLSGGRPRWNHRCEQCFGCINLCPVAAIQVRNRPTARRGRYHHPDIGAIDIGSQRRNAD